MKKKFYISLLTLLFFVSTTSLPLSVHLCKMAKSISAEECSSCMAAKQQKKCCAEDLNNTAVKFVKAKAPLCCSNQFVDAKVKDNFISTKTDVHNFSTLKIIAPVIVDLNSDTVNKFFSFRDKGSSPALLHTNQLYLFNSILLI